MKSELNKFIKVNIWVKLFVCFVLFLTIIVHYRSTDLARFKIKTFLNFQKIDSLIGMLLVGENIKDKFKQKGNINIKETLDEVNVEEPYPGGLRIDETFVKSFRNINIKLTQIEEKLNFNQESLARLSGLADVHTIKIYDSRIDSAGYDQHVLDTYIYGESGEKILDRHGSMIVRSDVLGKNIFRILIHFRNFKEVMPHDAKIFSAILYLKQKIDMYSQYISNESIVLFPIKREWGVTRPNTNHTGYTTWVETKKDEMLWNTPGLWPDARDVEQTMIASAVGINQSNVDRWIPFYFNSSGLDHLQAIIQGSESFGWLIRNQYEVHSKASIRFYSTNADIHSRPYLEIMYILNN